MLKNIEQNLKANKTKYCLCYILILVAILGCAQTTEQNKSKEYEEVYVLLNAKYITNGKITREENYEYNKDGKKTSYEVKLDNGRLLEFEYLEYDKEGKLKTVNATGGIKIEYEYNKFGKIKLFKETNKDGHIYLKKKIKYDNRGNPIESQEIYGYAKTGKWEKTKYDNLGRVINQTEGVEDKITFSESYNYTKDGKKMKIESYENNVNTKYLYDDKGRNIRIIEVGEDKKEKVTEYEYNGDLLITEKTEKFLIKYIYDKIADKNLKKAKYVNDNNGKIVKTEEFDYDIHGLLLNNKVKYRKIEDNKIIEYIGEENKKTYWNNGMLKAEEYYVYCENGTKLFSQYTILYNDKCKKIEEFRYNKVNSIKEKNYFEYDVNGNLIKKIFENLIAKEKGIKDYTQLQELKYIKIKRLKGDEVK